MVDIHKKEINATKKIKINTHLYVFIFIYIHAQTILHIVTKNVEGDKRLKIQNQIDFEF